MHLRIVVKLTGQLLLLLGLSMCAPLGVAFHYGGGAFNGEVKTFLIAIGVTFVAGIVLSRFKGDTEQLSGREGFAVVTFGWLTISLFGSIPFALIGHPEIPTYVDAFFESISGFTTTGASVLSDIESLPKGILFWRSMTHWLGGMGIVVLVVAILPSLGAAGFQLMRAEVPGPDTDRLRPRIAATAKIMWGTYVILSLMEFGLLMAGGMDWFDAACHTFGTLATGGFSTRNASIGAFDSSYFEWVIIGFMLVGTLNFTLHYHALRGRFAGYWKSEETRLVLLIIAVAVLFVAGMLWLDDREGADHGSVHDVVRTSVFSVLTIVSTTGYGVSDQFDAWPEPLRWLMLVLMFIGGSSGSTAGSLKVFRWLLLGKLALRELRRLINPRRVIAIKLDGKAVDNDAISSVISVMLIYLMVFLVITLLVACLLPADTSLETSVSAVAASVGCVGPGLDKVGPTQNYKWMPWHVKLLLCLCMLLGRLELVTVLVLLAPRAWRR